MTEAIIGYDVVKYIMGMLEPDKYRAHRIRHGRYVTKSPFFATHKEALQWIDAQRGLDRDDKDRARIPPPRKE
jgi:hypothetical protein